jgi:RNA polymerase sigma factor (sigma-70 family)
MSRDGDAADAALLAAGDHARLLAKYEPVIIGRCIAELRGHLDADDVAQDVKVRLWKELAAGKSYAVPFRVVVHKVIGWTAKDYFAGRPTHVPLPEAWDPADPSDDLGELIDRDAVSSMLDDLAEGKTKQVMELRYLDRLEIREIAAALELEENAVHQALHRGHRKLRETLTDG